MENRIKITFHRYYEKKIKAQKMYRVSERSNFDPTVGDSCAMTEQMRSISGQGRKGFRVEGGRNKTQL